MTVPIAAEAVGELASVEGTAAAGAGAAGEGAGAVRGAAADRSITGRTGVTPPKPKATSPAGGRPAGKPAAGESAPESGRKGNGAPDKKGSGGKSQQRKIKMPKYSGIKGSGAAHKIVIAEFILCIVLIGAAPILVRPPGKDSGGKAHLYVANDFLRLTATCLLFFVLALLANEPRSAKFAAAFGGLVTLGAVYNANKAFISLAALFPTKTAASSAAATGAASAATGV